MAADVRTANATKILGKAEDAKQQFIFTFNLLEESRSNKNRSETSQSPTLRGKKPSSSLHSLRAMVVFAGAGMDSVVQQLLKDGLQTQVENNEAAFGYFRKMVGFLMAGKSVRDAREEGAPDHIDKLILRDALLHPDGTERFFVERILKETDLTSFQSKAALEQAAQMLGVLGGDPPSDQTSNLRNSIEALKPSRSSTNALDVRNKIVHDFDIDLSEAGGRGKSLEVNRSLGEMEQYADQMLDVARNLIAAVEADPSPLLHD